VTRCQSRVEPDDVTELSAGALAAAVRPRSSASPEKVRQLRDPTDDARNQEHCHVYDQQPRPPSDPPPRAL